MHSGHLLLASLFLSSAAIAQVPLSGAVFDGSGGPLVAGTVYHAQGNLNVPAGQTLTVQPGAILKFWSSGLSIDGTLLAQGTAGSPIVFTSMQDDSAGGDTNGNGPSAGGPDQWVGLSFGAGADASVLERFEVRYTGVGFSPAIRLNGADVTLRHGVLRDGQHGLLDLQGSSLPIVEQCAFLNTGSRPAIHGATFDALPGFLGNTASGTGAGNYVEMLAIPAGDPVISAGNCLNGWLVFPSGIHIPAGRTVTLGAGIILKMHFLQAVQVDGTLKTQGTQANPVVFTSLPDDGYGGDTNNNGPSGGAPDQWAGLRFSVSAGQSSLQSTVIRYTGTGFSAGVEVFGASLKMTDCLIRDGQHGAIDFNNTAANPLFTRCVFQDNKNYAVQLPIMAVPSFVDCFVLGSTYGQFLRVVNGVVTGPLAIGPENAVGGAVVLAASLHVPAGQSLTLRRGTVFKAEGQIGVQVDGTLNVPADGSSPVVFTTIPDDEFGGDTNQNGPSSGTPDVWFGLSFSSTASGTVNGLRVRYAGSGFSAGVNLAAPGVSLRAVRTDRCAHDGLRVSAHNGDARDWVAFNCIDQGIELQGGSFTLRNATVVGSTAGGIVAGGGFTGTVRECLSFGNGGGDYVGLPAGAVSWSLAATFAGQNGNFGGNPMLLDQAGGDLRLAAGSPCIEAGDPGVGASGGDAGGSPRWTDGDFGLGRRIDVGAYEYSNVQLAISGVAKPGGALTFTTSGTPGLPVLLAIGIAGQVELPPHGTLFINPALPWLLLPFASAPSAVVLPVPSNFLVPVEIAFQELALSGGKVNLSNVVHLRFTH